MAYRVVSLFSGAMGLDLGIEATGRYELLACVEQNRSSCATIRANRPTIRLLERDISTLDPQELLDAIGLQPGDIDLLIGGPPCQAFSTAGKRGATQDPRGALIWRYLRFIEVLRPRFFVMENVRAILSAALQPGAAPGSVIQAFATKLRALTDASYHMDCFEVNAVNYGAPQLRERAIFIGNRFNVVADLPDPTHGPSSQHPWRTLRDALDGLRDPGPVRMEFSERKLRYLGMVPPGSNWRSLPEDIQRESMGAAWSAKGGRSGWWRRLSMDLPCPTLVAAPNHASTALCHPEEVRALTLRECARIQEFPDDWAFHGSPSEQFKQVGNAVPVRLGTIVGEAVASELDALRERGWRPYAERPEAFRRVYIQSHVRTRRWHKEGVALVWGREDEARHAAPKTGRRTQKIQGA